MSTTSAPLQPMHGCSWCTGTGGVASCPHHGPQAIEEVNVTMTNPRLSDDGGIEDASPTTAPEPAASAEGRAAVASWLRSLAQDIEDRQPRVTWDLDLDSPPYLRLAAAALATPQAPEPTEQTFQPLDGGAADLRRLSPEERSQAAAFAVETWAPEPSGERRYRFELADRLMEMSRARIGEDRDTLTNAALHLRAAAALASPDSAVGEPAERARYLEEEALEEAALAVMQVSGGPGTPCREEARAAVETYLRCAHPPAEPPEEERETSRRYCNVAGPGGYICTEERDHAGGHVACGGMGHVYERWPRQDVSEEGGER